MDEAHEAHAVGSQNRSELLLCAAVDAFGKYGYMGASLREIARDAGSSLTLIAHHFGNKKTLLDAAIAAFHRAAAGQLIVLRAEIDGASTLRMARLVETWVRYAVALFGNRAGLPYLRLMLRLQTDPALDAAARLTLDPAEPTLRRAMRRLRPGSSQATLDLAWEASSAALYSSIMRDGGAGAGSVGEDRRQAALEAFLAAALNSLFEEARSLA